MLIFFEKLLQNPQLVDTLSPEHSLILEGLFEYVEGRLMPFKDEIEAIEEAEMQANAQKGTKLESFVLIHFPNKGIGVHGYTDELRKKMVDSFSQMDIDPMWQKIHESLKAFLN